MARRYKGRPDTFRTDLVYILNGTIPASPYSKFFLYLPTLGETERKKSNPRFLVLPGSRGEVFLIVDAQKSQLELSNSNIL